MKICDRCFKSDGSVVGAVEAVTFGMSHEVVDVCLSCSENIKSFSQKKEPNGSKRIGRPPGKGKVKDA